MRTIGQNIRYYRKKRRFTQEKLAELADVNEKSLSFYENDKRLPPIFALIDIAKALEVSLEELCGVSLPDPSTELERELNKAIRNVLKEFKIERQEGVEKK